MTWLAVGGCSVAATYALYVLFSHYNAKYSKNGAVPEFLVEDTTLKNAGAPQEKTLSELQYQETENNSNGSIFEERPNIFLNGSEKSHPTAKDGLEQRKENDHKSAHPSISMPPPPLPSITNRSYQIRSQSPPRLKPPTFSTLPTPSRVSNGPPPSAASSLRVPVTKVLPNTSMAPSNSSLLPPSSQTSKSRQVTLKPGHSPLDWAALTSSPTGTMILRGKDAQPPQKLLRIPPSRLKYQNGRKGKDAWTVYQGKVYNITAYLPFHPGGESEIMKGAGRDSGSLFLEVHPWVNWDGMLGECLVGILIGETEKDENHLDEMD